MDNRVLGVLGSRLLHDLNPPGPRKLPPWVGSQGPCLSGACSFPGHTPVTKKPLASAGPRSWAVSPGDQGMGSQRNVDARSAQHP